MSDPLRWGVTAKRQDPTRGSPRETLVHMTAGTSVAQRGFFVSALVVAVASCSGGSRAADTGRSHSPASQLRQQSLACRSSSSGSETGVLVRVPVRWDASHFITARDASLGKWKQDEAV